MRREDSPRLPQPGALGDEAGDGDEQLWISHPVAHAKCGSREASSAVSAEVVLDAAAVAFADVGTVSDEVPMGLGRVEVTCWIGAMGRLEAAWAAVGVSRRMVHTLYVVARFIPAGAVVPKEISIHPETVRIERFRQGRSRFLAPQPKY